MELVDRQIVVTGAAGGIGQALVRRFAAEGARAVVAADRDLEGARALAAEVGALAVEFDAGREDSVRELIATASEAHGRSTSSSRTRASAAWAAARRRATKRGTKRGG